MVSVIGGFVIPCGSGWPRSASELLEGDHGGWSLPRQHASERATADDFEVRGVVRDGSTLTAVEGAYVYAREEIELGPTGPASRALERKCTTGKDGSYGFTELGPTTYRIEAVAPGYGWVVMNSIRRGSRQDFALFPASWISGLVTDSGGKPVHEARVCVSEEPASLASCPRPVQTDPTGRFDVWGVRSEKNVLVLAHEELAPAIIHDVMVPEHGEARVDVRLHNGARVFGRLVGHEDRPVAGAVIVQEIDDEVVPPFLIEELTSAAGADGLFRIGRVPHGAHALAFSADGYNVGRVEFSVTAKDTSVDVGDLRLESGLTIRGTVQDSAGAPIENARVRARQVRSTVAIPSFDLIEVLSKEDGSFVMGGIHPGQYQLKTEASGYGLALLDAVEAGSERLAITLFSKGFISGEVVDERSRALHSYQITARPHRSRAGEYVSETVVAPEGEFRVAVGAGAYLVTVEAPRFLRQTISDVEISPGEATALGQIRLEKGETIRGVAIDEFGYGVFGATVRVLASGEGEGLYTRAVSTASTASDGSFEIHGVPRGTVSIVGEHPQFSSAVVDRLNVRPSEGASGVRIVFTRGGTLQGFVRKRDGTPTPDRQVQVSSGLAGSNLFSAPTLVNTKPDGTFMAEQIRPGAAKVELLAVYGGTILTVQEKLVEIMNDETTFVEFVSREIHLSGYATQNGAPVARSRLTFVPERFSMIVNQASNGFLVPVGPQLLRAVTDDYGYFELLADSPGTYLASLSTFDERTSFSTRAVEIPDIDYLNLNLDFSGVPVSGRVLDSHSKRPIPGVNVVATPITLHVNSGGAAASGGDGRFSMELSPGRFRVTVRSPDYSSNDLNLEVGKSGASDVTILVSRQAILAGHVFDSAGTGVAGLEVSATGVGLGTQAIAIARSEVDGSFHFEGIGPGDYTLFARSSIGGFGFARVTAPKDEKVALRLSPGGLARIRVRDGDRSSIAGARVRLVAVQGMGITDLAGEFVSRENGAAEIWLPATSCRLQVGKDDLTRHVDILVHPDSTVDVETVLSREGQPR